MGENLIEGLQKEIERVRDELLPLYDEIPTGVFAATMMRVSIKEAENAIANMDVIQMIRSLEDLRGYTD